MDIITATRLARKHNISTTAVAVITCIDRLGPSKLSHVAKTIGLTGATITSIADTLTRRGLAQRQATTDRRAWLLTLTSEGSKIVAPS